MFQLDLGVLFAQELGHRLAPETRGSEDIGLVDRRNGQRGVGGERDLGRDAGDALDFGDRVDTCVPCGLVGRFGQFLALAKVCQCQLYQLSTLAHAEAGHG